MSTPRQEQFTGCLLGQALGDALGSAVEGQAPAVCGAYVASVLRPALRSGDPRGISARGGVAFGQYTDDTQLARELLESLVRHRGFVAEDYARRIGAIFKEGRIFGCGQSTLQAAERLNRGVPWRSAGTPPPAAGNGTAMRVAPVGLYYHGARPEELARVAHEQGYITHQDPRCSGGSVVIAAAVARALRGAPQAGDEAGLLEGLAGLAEAFEPTLPAALRALSGWLKLPPEEAVVPISRAGRPEGEAERDRWQGISPFVNSSVLWSLYSYLRTPDDYGETLCTAIAVGGDVDTTAAMAGALSGARLGLSAVPEGLRQRLTDQGTWGCDELIELAEEAYRQAAAPRAGLRGWLGLR